MTYFEFKKKMPKLPPSHCGKAVLASKFRFKLTLIAFFESVLLQKII